MHAWGRLDADWSQRKIDEFPTEDEARAEALAQVERRERRGYVRSD